MVAFILLLEIKIMFEISRIAFGCRTQEFIELECEELATIDALRDKADKEDNALPSTPFLLNGKSGKNQSS